jgi:hypothetical protein
MKIEKSIQELPQRDGTGEFQELKVLGEVP